KGSIDIQQNRPYIKLEYSGDKPHQITADMDMSSAPAEMDIDLSKAYAELGFHRINSLLEFLKDKNQREILESLRQISQDGDYLGKLEAGGNRIAQLSKDKMRSDEK